VGTVKVVHRFTGTRKFSAENFQGPRTPLSRELRSPQDDQNVRFDKGNVAVVIKSRSDAVSGKKGQNFSLPGSRTPRCPVTGDDVTDTPEEMLSWYQNKINSICSTTTVRAADLRIIVVALPPKLRFDFVAESRRMFNRSQGRGMYGIRWKSPVPISQTTLTICS
jgi:hypothetical protein